MHRHSCIDRPLPTGHTVFPGCPFDRMRDAWIPLMWLNASLSLLSLQRHTQTVLVTSRDKWLQIPCDCLGWPPPPLEVNRPRIQLISPMRWCIKARMRFILWRENDFFRTSFSEIFFTLLVALILFFCVTWYLNEASVTRKRDVVKTWAQREKTH